MTLAEYIRENITDTFAALPFGDCAVTLGRLLGDWSPTFAVMLSVPYPRGTGRIASFAMLRDYHVFFGSFEEDVRALLGERYPGREARIFSDHSPIDERSAACRAGLGVKGDNGLFISNAHGSFVFIGEILVSLTADELSSEGIEIRSVPIGECLHCGACRDACPAGACGGDKSLCIAALTQKKGALSDTERDIIRRGGSAWGCDVCAAVCPMNEGVTAEYKDFFLEGTCNPRCAADVFAMSDEEYGKYPFSWRRRDVIGRNFKIIDGEFSDGN